MPINRIQFQPGLSLPEFLEQFGTEAQCEATLERTRWPNGFRCPRCDCAEHCVLQVRKRKTFQCSNCGLQTSLIAGTLFQSTHLALTIWFLAIYLISEAKTGLSALALKRQLGVSYPTAWLIHHKLMQAMFERNAKYKLHGKVQIDNVYLGGERSGGKVGRGSENKVPFVAAVSINPDGHPVYVKMTPISGFTRQAINEWAKAVLDTGCQVVSDGLACFAGVTDAGCQHTPIVVGKQKPKELPDFNWINTIIGNLKTSLGGAYHAFKFAKYGYRYLAAFEFRFNRRFNLGTLPMRLFKAAVAISARPLKWLRSVKNSC